MQSSFLKRVIVVCFIAVPLLSSIISTVHLVDLFYLGNPSWISYTIAVAIEIGAVASFLTLSILSRLNKTIVWGMFFILFFMQIIGNVYGTYDWVTEQINKNPTWLTNFREMLEFFIFEIEEKTSKMMLSLILGIPIPLISVFLLKSMIDYLGDDSDQFTPPIETHSTEEKKEDVGEIHITENLDDEDEESRRKRIHAARS